MRSPPIFSIRNVSKKKHLITTERGGKIHLRSDRKLVETQYAALETAQARQSFIEERKQAVRDIAQVILERKLWPGFCLIYSVPACKALRNLGKGTDP